MVKVTGVMSRYCDGAYGGAGRHVFFLGGVALPVAFTAQVEWGGKTGSRLEFNGASHNWPEAGKTLDVGNLGPAGGEPHRTGGRTQRGRGLVRRRAGVG